MITAEVLNDPGCRKYPQVLQKWILFNTEDTTENNDFETHFYPFWPVTENAKTPKGGPLQIQFFDILKSKNGWVYWTGVTLMLQKMV